MKKLLLTLLLLSILNILLSAKLKVKMPSYEFDKMTTAEEEKSLDDLADEVLDAVEHEDLNELENQPPKIDDSFNNEAEEEAKEIERQLNKANGIKDHEDYGYDLEID